jgi:hypothetical protein
MKNYNQKLMSITCIFISCSNVIISSFEWEEEFGLQLVSLVLLEENMKKKKRIAFNVQIHQPIYIYVFVLCSFNNYCDSNSVACCKN